MSRIDSMETIVYRIPLTVPVQAASTDVMSAFDLVMVRLRDADGAEGWVHKSLLTGRRSILVTGAVRSLRRDPDAASAAVARAEPGVVGRLLVCGGGWCRIEVDGLKGWLPQADFWGTYRDEVVD